MQKKKRVALTVIKHACQEESLIDSDHSCVPHRFFFFLVMMACDMNIEEEHKRKTRRSDSR